MISKTGLQPNYYAGIFNVRVQTCLEEVIFRLKQPLVHSKNPDVLAALSNDENEDIQLEVAKNPKTPSEILGMMAVRGKEDTLLKWVAENRNTTPETLEYIFHKIAERGQEGGHQYH